MQANPTITEKRIRGGQVVIGAAKYSLGDNIATECLDGAKAAIYITNGKPTKWRIPRSQPRIEGHLTLVITNESLTG